MKRASLLAQCWRAVVLLMAFTSVGAKAQVPSAQTHLQEVSRRLDSLLRHYRIPGAQIALVHKDSVLLQKNYGLSDVARR